MGQCHIFQISQAMILEQWTDKEKGRGVGGGIVSGTQRLSEAFKFHWHANQVPPPSSTTTTLTYILSRDSKDTKVQKTPGFIPKKSPQCLNYPEHSQSIVKASQSIPRASSEHS